MRRVHLRRLGIQRGSSGRKGAPGAAPPDAPPPASSNQLVSDGGDRLVTNGGEAVTRG